MTSVETLSYDNPVFRAYVFWSSILVLKMLAMSYLTGRQRMKNKTVANPEDLKFLNDAKAVPKFNDEDVERVRRAHRNDLENCLPFMAIAFLYTFTNPDAFIAINLIRAAVLARIGHTLFYAIMPMQPWRAISYFVCLGVTAFMAIKTALFFL